MPVKPLTDPLTSYTLYCGFWVGHEAILLIRAFSLPVVGMSG